MVRIVDRELEIRYWDWGGFEDGEMLKGVLVGGERWAGVVGGEW